MSETLTLPNPTAPGGHRVPIEEILDPAFLELLRLVPGNPHVRALLLKLTGKMPGTECATFDQIKDWAEIHCEKRIRPLLNRADRGVPQDGISIPVDFSETEYGRADYSVRRHGSGEFLIDAADLSELVQAAVEAGDGIDRIVERVAAKIDEDAWSQCEPDMDDFGDYDYSDHDSTSTDDSETTYSENVIHQAVLAFVRARHPELAAEL